VLVSWRQQASSSGPTLRPFFLSFCSVFSLLWVFIFLPLHDILRFFYSFTQTVLTLFVRFFWCLPRGSFASSSPSYRRRDLGDFPPSRPSGVRLLTPYNIKFLLCAFYSFFFILARFFFQTEVPPFAFFRLYFTALFPECFQTLTSHLSHMGQADLAVAGRLSAYTIGQVFFLHSQGIGWHDSFFTPHGPCALLGIPQIL